MAHRDKVSRRALLRNAGIAVAAATLDTPGFAAGSPFKESPMTNDDQRTRVLALIGDRYHNSDYIRVSLDKLFHHLGMAVDYTTQYDHLSRSLLGKYQLFVCLRDGMIWPGGYLGPDAYTDYAAALENAAQFPKPEPQSWMTTEQGDALKDFVASGGAFYALHNSSHISLSSPSYREVMGGAYIGHPPLRPFRVRVVKSHPITEGVADFMVNDEQHYVTYDKDPQNILLRAENIDRLTYEDHGAQSISGWAHEYGKGRVVFTAVGHNIYALWQPEYLKIQNNAVKWLLKLT